MTHSRRQPLRAEEHYFEADRLIRAAESLTDVTLEAGPTMAVLALAHAVLATAPNRVAKRATPRPGPRRVTGGNPQQRWERGEDQ